MRKIDKDIARIIALQRQAKILAEDLGCMVSVDAVPDSKGTPEDDVEHFNVWAYVGDYTNYNMWNEEPRWSYTSKDKAEAHVDPERIISFTTPPKEIEKSPATDQSAQGLSIDN